MIVKYIIFKHSFFTKKIKKIHKLKRNKKWDLLDSPRIRLV